MILYHMPEYSETNIDMEVAIAIPAPLPALENTPQTRVKTRQLSPIKQAATVIHRGMIYDIPVAITALFRWIGMNGYTSIEATQEIHLFGRETSRVMEEPIVLELQVPIQPLRYSQIS